MKKIIAVCLFIAVTCTALAACSSGDDQSDAGSSSPAVSSADSVNGEEPDISSGSGENSQTLGSEAEIADVDPTTEPEEEKTDVPSEDGGAEKTDTDSVQTDSADVIFEDEATGEPSKFEGEISTRWADIKDDFSAAESDAANEASGIETVSKEDVKALTDVIISGYDKIKDGISDNDTAKEIYKAASGLETLGERHTDTVDLEVVRLGRNVKKLIRHLYGEAEDDYYVLKGDVEIAIDSVDNYGGEDWNEVVSLLN